MSNPEKYLILSGGTILSMSPEVGIIENGYIICKGNKITQIGQGDYSSNLPPNISLLDTRGKLVMPGLINTHTHAAMALLSGIADDLPLMQWLNEHIFPLEGRLMSPEFVYTGTMLSGLSMLRSGTTTLVDGYFYEDSAATAIKELGLRGIMAQGVLDFPNPQYDNPGEGLKIIRDFIKKWQGDDLIHPAIFCHSPYTCSPDTLIEAKLLSRETASLYLIHLSETVDEVEEIKKRYGSTPVRHLENLGVLDNKTLAVHCVWLDQGEIDKLGEKGVKVAHCPESNMKLAAGIAPVPQLISKGVCVGLGTDSCASNNNLDLFQEMDTTAKLHKINNVDPTLMDAQGVLEMATVRAAEAIGLGHLIGTLETGKKADIICIDLNQPHLTPLYNISSQLIYAATGADVDTVIVDGEILLQNRKYTKCDPGQILNTAKKWAKRIIKFKASSNGREPK